MLPTYVILFTCPTLNAYPFRLFRFTCLCYVILGCVFQCWRCFAEVVNSPETELSTALLCLPAVAPISSSPPSASSSGDGRDGLPDDSRAHARFAAFSDLVSKSLLMCGGDKVLGLVHFHPLYDRNKVTFLSVITLVP